MLYNMLDFMWGMFKDARLLGITRCMDYNMTWTWNPKFATDLRSDVALRVQSIQQ